MTADVAAMAELWRSAMALGSSGVRVPGLEGIVGEGIALAGRQEHPDRQAVL